MSFLIFFWFTSPQGECRANSFRKNKAADKKDLNVLLVCSCVIHKLEEKGQECSI